MLGASQIEEAAALLTAARRNGVPLESLGELTPEDHPQAEAIADAHARSFGVDVVGWKVGCTSEDARQMLDSPGPFAGRIFAGTVHDPGVVEGSFVHARAECEFAFLLAADLPPRHDARDLDHVQPAVAAVAPAIEIIDTRFDDFTGVGYLSLIADSGANGGVILGEPIPTNELPDLAAVQVCCVVDGIETGAGTGADVLGDPWNALVWLVNHLSSRGIGLEAGQFVLSGTCTGVTDFPAGSTVEATYSGLGLVEASRPPG